MCLVLIISLRLLYIALNLLYNLYEYDIDRFKVPFTTFHAKIPGYVAYSIF